MCIIGVFPFGINANDETGEYIVHPEKPEQKLAVADVHKWIDNCAWNNPDGAGLMYYDYEAGNVAIDKGWMDGDVAGDMLEYASATVGPVILHFRIATHGSVGKGTCHPFPIGGTDAELMGTSVNCSIGLAHNGVCRQMPIDREFSDTQQIVRKLREMQSELPDAEFTERFIAMFLDALDSGCFALLGPTGIQLVGSFESEKGLAYFSNTTYKRMSYQPLKGGVTGNVGTSANKWAEGRVWVGGRWVDKEDKAETTAESRRSNEAEYDPLDNEWGCFLPECLETECENPCHWAECEPSCPDPVHAMLEYEGFNGYAGYATQEKVSVDSSVLFDEENTAVGGEYLGEAEAIQAAIETEATIRAGAEHYWEGLPN